MRAPKGEGAATARRSRRARGGLVCLTGGAGGPVAARLAPGRRGRARAISSSGWSTVYGRFNVHVELQRHLSRAQEAQNDWLRARASSLRLPLVATNAPRLVAREDRPLLDVLTCIREHTTLDAAGRLLSQNSERFMKSGRVMERLFADCPEAVANSGELSLRLGFTLKDLGYQFPDYPLPPGETPIGYLRALSEAGARTRYGTGSSRRRRAARSRTSST